MLKPLSRDTDPRVWQRIIDGYRRMSPGEKLARVGQLNRAAQQMALARLRREYPDDTERELQLRLAALWLDVDTMRRVFGCHPDHKGG